MRIRDSVYQTDTADAVSPVNAAAVLLWCLLGVLIPRATLYGEMAPFGIGLAASVTVGRWPVTLAMSAGYLFAEAVTLPLRYVIAVAVVGGARWVVAAVPELERQAAVPPLIAFVSSLATGLVIYGQGGLDGYRVLLVVAESVVAAGSALFFRVAVRQTSVAAGGESPVLSAGGQASLLFTAAVTAMAASTIQVGGFSPGRAVAALLVLILAYAGRETGGCLAGCILGGAMALTTPDYAAVAVALTMGGLLAGAFAPYGRVAQAAVLFVTAGVVTLPLTEGTVLMFLCELLIAGGGFFLLSKSLILRVARPFLRERELPAAEGVRRLTGMRLKLAADGIRQVESTVTAVSRRLTKTDAESPAAVCRDGTRQACDGCSLYALCRGQNRDKLYQGLEALLPLLRREGAVTAAQVADHLGFECRRPDKMTEYVNRSYEQYLAREGAWQRLQELQSTLQHQFGGVGHLLRGLAEDLEDARRVDTELSGRVLAVCRDFGMPVQDALCIRGRNGRLTVDILTDPNGVPPAEGRWRRQIHAVCGRDMDAPAVTRHGRWARVTLTEPPRYRPTVAVAKRVCDGEKLCGDAVEQCTASEQTVVVLSDGMGCGGRAAVDGAMAAGLTARLWEAGFCPEGILQTVSAALQVKSREETLATLDVAVIDGFTGRLDSYKAGAATTLLYSDGRVSRIERPSLPLGILTDVTFEHSHDTLVEGDVLVLLSDGAFPDGVAPMEALLAEHVREDTPQELADRLADAARRAQQKQDDVTVVAIRMEKA